jgi:hypothetical protein
MGLLNRAKLAVNTNLKKKVTKRNKALYRTQVATGDMTEQQYKELTGEDF